MYWIERFSDKIGHVLALKLKLDKDQEEVIAYGAFNFLQVFFSILSVIIFGAVFGVLLEAVVISFAIGILRKYSGGVHASSPNRCIIVGTIVSVLFAIIIHNGFYLLGIRWTYILGIICFVISYYIIIKFAPVDSAAKPIKKVETRKRLKRYSILALNIFATIAIMLSIIYIKKDYNIILNVIQSIYIGCIWQAFTLTPMAHDLLTKLDKVFNII